MYGKRIWGVDGESEGGFALIVSMVVATVGIMMVTTVLAMGVHLEGATVRQRQWNLSFQVAEAGVNDAVRAMAADPTLSFTGTGGPVDVSGGQYQTSVVRTTDGFRVDAVGWVPSAAAVNAVQRRLRVEYAPEPSFRYALYSDQGAFVKSVGGVEGDVFANLSVELGNGTRVTGSVQSAEGTVHLYENAKVVKDGTEGGDVYSGGYSLAGGSNPYDYAVRLDGSTRVEGTVYAKVAVVCGDAIRYNVQLANTATIGEGIVVPGGAGAVGPGAGNAGSVQTACEPRSPQRSLPSFVFQESAYVAKYGAVQYVDAASWETVFPRNSDLSGAIYVRAASPSDSIDISCRTINGSAGDFVLISEARVEKPNVCGERAFYSGPTTRTLQLIVLNSSGVSDPAVEIENKLEIPYNSASTPPAAALLLYSTGYCDLGNSVLALGAVYCRGMNIFNNLDITYDERIRNLLGFGDSLLTRSSFRELPANTPL